MKHSKKSRQFGVSLIELMVGLVLSLIVILGMVATYTTLGRSTIEAKLGTLNDSKVTTALVTADRLLQGVGFGLSFSPGSYGTSIQVYQETSPKNIGEEGDLIVWKTGTSKCSALIGGKKLEFLENYTCTSGLNIPTASGIPAFSGSSVSLPNAPDAGLFKFTISQLISPGTSCRPYGVTGSSDGGKYIAKVTVGIYSGSESNLTNTLKSETCLFNIK